MGFVGRIGFPHSVVYQGTSYEFIDGSMGYVDACTAEIGGGVFDIIDVFREFDLDPNGMEEYPYAAYCSQYVVKGKRLILDALYIDQGIDANYLPVMGIVPERTAEDVTGRCYRNLKYHVKYTGCIMIGQPWRYLKQCKSYIQETRRYRKIVVLELAGGILAKAHVIKRTMRSRGSKLNWFDAKVAAWKFANEIFAKDQVVKRTVRSRIPSLDRCDAKIPHDKVMIPSNLQPEMPPEIEKRPPVPIEPVTIVQGVPYRFVAGYRTGELFRDWSWPPYSGVWKELALEAERPISLVPKMIYTWNWEGVTEEFEVKADGKIYLENLYLHLGKHSIYPEILGARPKIVLQKPMIQYYRNLNFECWKQLNGKFLLGKRQAPDKIRGIELGTPRGFILDERCNYDCDVYIEITVRNGVLEVIRDVTALLREIQTWLKEKSNPELRLLDNIEARYPLVVQEHCYWFDKYGCLYE